MVEHPAVNRRVTGSSPVRGAIVISDITAEGPPVPIPNTEVKLCRGEDT